jgi:diguanylate cyclase (GGDEF)-like protein
MNHARRRGQPQTPADALNRRGSFQEHTMSMQLITSLIYWTVVVIWLAVLTAVVVHYIRNPRIFGTTRLLLLVVAIDTIRNLVENVYFGLLFGSQYGLFNPALAKTLGNPYLLVQPKLLNIISGCLVLGLLLMRWLPQAVSERSLSDRANTDLEILATTDGLTKLINRRHFEALARNEWARFQRYGRPLSIMAIDVDHFKSINDRYGHDGGDVVLRTIADLCQASKRQPDVLARIGGEEFVMLLPETDEDAGALAADRLRETIQNAAGILPDKDLHVTISIGIAGATLSMASYEAMLKRADEALYEAKRAGRNRVMRAPALLHDAKLAAE